MEEAGHNEDEVEVRSLLVHVKFEIGDLFVHRFLKNFPLIILKPIFGDTAAPVEDVDQPDHNSVEDKIVGEERRYVSVPYGREGRVEAEIGHFQEIGNIGGDDGQEGDVAAGLETEYIGVD